MRPDQVLVAVLDSAVQAYMTPFFAPTNAAAIRAFSDEVARTGSPMSAHPSDYSLFKLGDFDSQLGLVRSVEMPEALIRGVDCVKKGNGHAS